MKETFFFFSKVITCQMATVIKYHFGQLGFLYADACENKMSVTVEFPVNYNTFFAQVIRYCQKVKAPTSHLGDLVSVWKAFVLTFQRKTNLKT